LKPSEIDTTVDFLGIFMYEYCKMILLLFLILLVVFLLPVYQKPRVFHNFLTPEERNHIMTKAEKELKPSTVSSEKILDDSIRKSETAWLSREDPVVDKIIHRCLGYTDRPVDNCEKLQVLRYKPGGFYKPHQDVLDGNNPRLYTFILALNDDYEGGETAFPNLGNEYRLKAGDALLFDTLDNYELETSKALHGGKPVKSGEKWICNLWIRKYPYGD
jgi:predicted 2-oxoglutarate/Fe(II)-dependent dioxygenase YbiX